MKCPNCKCEFEHPGWSLEECQAMAGHPTVGMRAAMVEAFWAHYASVGWVDGAGREIKDLRAALIKWRNNQASHGKKYRQENPVIAATEKVRRI